MYGILVSALNTFLTFLVRSILVKFVTFFALFFVVSGFIDYLAPLLPNAGALNASFGNIGSGVWYFLDLFQFSTGISAIISAYTLRFMIRRIPVIG
jgi:hypothetical protein